jgi:hypothetical protein
MWTFVLVAALSVLLTLVVMFAVARLRRRHREPSAAIV